MKLNLSFLAYCNLFSSRFFTVIIRLRSVVCRYSLSMSQTNEKTDPWIDEQFISEKLKCAKVSVQIDFESNRSISIAGELFNVRGIVGVGDSEGCVSLNSDLDELKSFVSRSNDFILGYFSYDLKNSLECLSSDNPDFVGFNQFHFFVPQELYFKTDNGWLCQRHGNIIYSKVSRPTVRVGNEFNIASKQGYIHQVENLQQHIQFGDIYEVNYCIQHGFENAVVEPYRLYQELQENSPAPFSCYVADNGKYLMSSSPERFMKKEGNRIFSQPMKGTNRSTSDNKKQKEELRNNAKEVAENVMITDLVRNDLSRSAKKGSIKVDELCGVYEFEHVNAMISTVSGELREDVHPLDALLRAFPMGSMTGAPKIRAMELIDQFEDFSRGLYSGAVGYFTPDLDFDFNVVIRSVLYNEEKQIVTFPTGGAITINSDPEKEYEECMLKAEAMRNVLLNHAK